jgi:hypothetical protein
MAANISSGQGLGITRPGRAEGQPVKQAATRAIKAAKVKSIKVKFAKGK